MKIGETNRGLLLFTTCVVPTSVEVANKKGIGSARRRDDGHVMILYYYYYILCCTDINYMRVYLFNLIFERVVHKLCSNGRGMR